MAYALMSVALVAALAAAAWLAVRYLLLKRSLRRADAELREIVERLEENRIVRLPSPDADLEALLATVNSSLAGIRRQAVLYERREAELKAQVERISHDLRTPLTSIQGYLALVDVGALDADARASLATIRRKADALQRLIAQFYDLSRFEAEDFRLELARVDVGRLVREQVAEQYRLLEGRGLDVRVDAPRHAVEARANADAVERVLANLLHNAAKYARSRFEATVEEGEAEVAVVFANDVDDAGQLEVERLFEPHYTGDAARTQESSGLGLTIARHLAERMGATLEARAEERDGAPWLAFVLRVPRG
ncbi:sensor histidine kinase [Arabiibacter massiliensis]|uniref:sensor histidine kinase n=1 Tax=Arabiibacter massiliensis TaxID=1870985 RepID=UPI001E357848|nr:HAMP domain-containing sensor histidine kinase [Arabiibacter massiliensis]